MNDERRGADHSERSAAFAELTAALVRISLDGVITIDQHGRITEFNPAAESIFGFSREALLGQPMAEYLIPIGMREMHYAGMARYLETRDARILDRRVEVTALRADGSEFPIELTVSRVSTVDPPTFAAFVRDITARKALESELRETARELTDANRRKDEFLATLAHELRNPLAPIRHATQVLRRTLVADAEQQRVFGMLERQVDQLVRLVDDLLDMSRTSRGKIELRRQALDLRDVARNAIEAARTVPECTGRQLTARLPEHAVVVDADPTRLAQVIGNLLNNACKFTGEGGHVELSVDSDAREALIRVRDDGIGIAAEHLPRVFDLFMQANNSLERRVSGLGIGLTLVRSLVEMHGGGVEAHSAGLGRGSEFVIRLPLAASAGPAGEASFPLR